MIKIFYLIVSFILVCTFFVNSIKKKKTIENAVFAGAGEKAQIIENAVKYAVPIIPIVIIEEVILDPMFKCEKLPKVYSQFIKTSNCIRIRKKGKLILTNQLILPVPLPIEYIVNINYPGNYVPKYLDEVIEWFETIEGGFITLIPEEEYPVFLPFSGVVNFMADGMIDSPQSFQVVVI